MSGNPKWKGHVDTAAAIAMIAVAVMMTWSMFFRRPEPALVTPAATANRTPTVPKEPLEIGSGRSKGRTDAPVVVLEFSEFECPYCKKFVQDTLPEIEKNYVDTGRVHFVFQHFPLEAIHRNAFKAAEAADCAGDQGGFWPMHDRLFDGTGLSYTSLIERGTALGLASKDYVRCLETGKYSAQVRASIERARALGIKATPTFLVGLRIPLGRFKVTDVLRGARPIADFVAVFDRLLTEAGSR